VKIARLTDADDGDKVSSSCTELSNEMEGVEEGAIYIQEVSKTVICQAVVFLLFNCMQATIKQY